MSNCDINSTRGNTLQPNTQIGQTLFSTRPYFSSVYQARHPEMEVWLILSVVLVVTVFLKDKVHPFSVAQVCMEDTCLLGILTSIQRLHSRYVKLKYFLHEEVRYRQV